MLSDVSRYKRAAISNCMHANYTGYMVHDLKIMFLKVMTGGSIAGSVHAAFDDFSC